MTERTAGSWNPRRYWPTPKSRVGHIALWLSTITVVCVLLRLILGEGGAGGFFVGWAITFSLLASPFLLILLFRLLSRRLLWKVSNRLIVTYILMGLAPVVLFGTLTAIAGYILAGQYSINSALASINEAAELLRGETTDLASLQMSQGLKPTTEPLNFEQNGNTREGQFSLASLQNGIWHTVPIVSKRGFSPASPFDGQPKPAWMQIGFHNLVVLNDKLYLCRYSRAQEGPKTGEVLGALELDHAALNSMAASVGRMMIFSGFGLRSGDVGNPEKEAQTAEQEADSAQAARDAAHDARSNAREELRDVQSEGREELDDAQRDAQDQVSDAQETLSDARTQLENAKKSPDTSAGERKTAEESVQAAQTELQRKQVQGQQNVEAARDRLAGIVAHPPQAAPKPTPPAVPRTPAPDTSKPPKPKPATSAHRPVPAGKPAGPQPVANTAVPPATSGSDEGFSAISGGVLPAATHLFDQRVYFTAPLPVVGWSDGGKRAAMLVVISRPSALYNHLFATSMDVGSFVRTLLVAIAGVFALLELLALWMATRLSRTITRSVAGLYRGTTEIDKGNLGYRVTQERKDQLGALATSFNSMAGSIEDLLVQQREKERLISELAIAQEVQRNLFPQSPVSAPGLQLHAVCLPARTVSGDYFDFIFEHEHQTCIALGDISGKGISAALLMASLHSAVRAFSLGDNARTPSPARLLELLNRHLFSSTQANKYATLFLAFYDPETRRLVYSNGGHLTPFVLSQDGRVRRLDVGGSVVGLLDGLTYDEATIQLHPGDLLVAYTDGLTEPEKNDKEFGEDRLLEQLLLHRNQALPLVVEETFETLKAWIGNQEQPDDMTLLLVRQL